MKKLEIEKDIPLPPKRADRRIYLFNERKAGDSFFINSKGNVW